MIWRRSIRELKATTLLLFFLSLFIDKCIFNFGEIVIDLPGFLQNLGKSNSLAKRPP